MLPNPSCRPCLVDMASTPSRQYSWLKMAKTAVFRWISLSQSIIRLSAFLEHFFTVLDVLTIMDRPRFSWFKKSDWSTLNSKSFSILNMLGEKPQEKAICGARSQTTVAQWWRAPQVHLDIQSQRRSRGEPEMELGSAAGGQCWW